MSILNQLYGQAKEVGTSLETMNDNLETLIEADKKYYKAEDKERRQIYVQQKRRAQDTARLQEQVTDSLRETDKASKGKNKAADTFAKGLAGVLTAVLAAYGIKKGMKHLGGGSGGGGGGGGAGGGGSESATETEGTPPSSGGGGGGESSPQAQSEDKSGEITANQAGMARTGLGYSSMIPGFGPFGELAELGADIVSGDPLSALYSAGSLIPGAGWGFQALDFLHHLNKDDETKEREDQKFADFLNNVKKATEWGQKAFGNAEKKQAGGFAGMVPDMGQPDEGDHFLTSVAPGSFIMNRNLVAAMGYQSGGIPVALEKGEIALPPGSFNPGVMSFLNDAIPRFQEGGRVAGLSNLTPQDWSDLAYIVSAEAARGTNDEYGVAAAVLNRVADPVWPNSIMGVGTQARQFEAVYKGLAVRDSKLASKLQENKDKIAAALQQLNGRTDFKGQTMLQNKGASDIMFDPKGNFFHYSSQVGKTDPVPENPPEHWKKWMTGEVAMDTLPTYGGGSQGRENLDQETTSDPQKSGDWGGWMKGLFMQAAQRIAGSGLGGGFGAGAIMAMMTGDFSNIFASSAQAREEKNNDLADQPNNLSAKDQQTQNLAPGAAEALGEKQRGKPEKPPAQSNADVTGLQKVSHPQAGSGYTIPGFNDYKGRPVILSPGAMKSFKRMVDDSNGIVKASDVWSSTRSKAHNAREGGVPNSNHLYGNAIDIHNASKPWIKRHGRKYGWKWLDYSGHDGHFDYIGKKSGGFVRGGKVGSADYFMKLQQNENLHSADMAMGPQIIQLGGSDSGGEVRVQSTGGAGNNLPQYLNTRCSSVFSMNYRFDERSYNLASYS